MGQVLLLTLPTWGLVLAGYLAGRTRVLSREGVRGVSRFAFRIAIPVMLGRAMAQLTFAEPIEWTIWLAYYGGTLTVYACGMLISRRVWSHSLEQQAVYGLGSAFANVVVLGIPLVLSVYGPEGELPLFMIIALNSAVMLFVATSIVSVARGEETAPIPLRALVRQLTHPIVVGLGIGLAINLMGIPRFEPVDRAAEMLAGAAPPSALFALGASIAVHSFGGRIRETLGLVVLKNAVHPAVVYLMGFVVFDLPRPWAIVAVLLAAQPMGVNVFLFSEDSQTMVPTIGTSFVASTIVSVASVPVVLYLLGSSP
jgi:malonate transporter